MCSSTWGLSSLPVLVNTYRIEMPPRKSRTVAYIKRLAWGVSYHQLVAWGIQTEKSYHFSMPNKSGRISELRISLAVSAQQLVLVESYYALGHFMSKSDGAMAAIFFASRMDRHWGKNPSIYWGKN